MLTVSIVTHIVTDTDTDPRELAELGDRLRTDFLDTGVDEVRPRSDGPAPAGTKAAELLALGSFLVTVGGSLPMLRQVLATVRDWVALQPVRSVTLSLDGDTIEIGHATGDQQRRLVDAWIARHAGG